MGRDCFWDSEEQVYVKLWIYLAVWNWEELKPIVGTARSKTKQCSYSLNSELLKV